MSNLKLNATLNNSYNVSSTSSMVIKYFPSKLPYRVIEALTASNSPKNLKNLAARITKSGWAWFVFTRKLFVWRYLDDLSSSKPKASRCYELLLPASDISHKADLVCILNPSQSQGRFPCALAVSPEGSIRYWPNIFQENNFIDSIVTADLNGQECQILIDIQPLGCILGTTTNSLVHISIDFDPSNYQSPIVCRTLTTPQGLFSGIGRKFSSLIFGSLPTAHFNESRQLIRIIRNEPIDDNDDVLPLYILVLSNCSIQKWIIEDLDYETFCGQINLEKHLKEAFINKFWDRTTTHHNQISIWLMDIALNRFDEITLLSMCNNSDVPNENHFALITLSGDVFPSDESMSVDQSASPIKSFQYLRNINLSNDFRHTNLNTLNNSILSPQSQPFSLISEINSGNQQVCYIYNSTKLYRINQDSIDEIDFQISNDYLLGAVLCDQLLLLLTFKNGFISVCSSLSDSYDAKQLSSSDRDLVHMNKADKFSIVMKALNLFIRGEKIRAELLLQEVFPYIKSVDKKSNANTNELDETVCAVSTNICDHIPRADPRWSNFIEADDNNVQRESLGSVIITNQLEEKLSMHNSFIELLKCSNAWELLTSLTTHKSILPTKLILCEHTEKLLVCLALRKLYSKFGNIIENAIERVLNKRILDPKLLENCHLTSQDLFYREVTKVDELFWQLIELEELQFNSDQSVPDENLIISVTDIITIVFGEVCLYRQANGAIYKSAIIADCDYAPWSSDQCVSGVRETWLKQFDLIVRCFRIDSNIPLLNDPDQQDYIGQKLADLTDIILDSFKCQLSYLNQSNEKYSTLKRAFEVTRYKCLEILLRIKQNDRATLLAQKYEDFEILIQLCERYDNQDQLQQHAQRFADKGFSEYLFEWYLREGKHGKMLSSVANDHKLDEFLSNHDSLKWLHQLHLKKFKDASYTLKKLGTLEEDCPTRKKTMLSIGKLALIASGDSIYADFDDQIRILNYQFDLSAYLLQKNGLDRKTMKVLTPEKLVDILISGAEGPNEEIVNFQKALEIAEVVKKRFSSELHDRIQFKIWQKAFQKDDWNDYNTDNMEIFIKRSFFYQLAISYYGDDLNKLPSIDTLMERFSFLKENQKASYFLRATYEMILNNSSP